MLSHFCCCAICFCNCSAVKCNLTAICQHCFCCFTFRFPVRNLVFLTIFCFNHSCALETSSVKTMIGCCSCNSIKSTLVILITKVIFIGRRRITCGLNSFGCPVFCPAKACINICIRICKVISKCIIFCIACCFYNNFKFLAIFCICEWLCCCINRTIFFDNLHSTSAGSLIRCPIHCYGFNTLDISS